MDATEIVADFWMGGELLPGMPHGFDAVIGCRWEADDYAIPLYHEPRLKVFAWVPMVDGPEMPPYGVLEVAMSVAIACRARRYKTLVHCAEGHNRSGLVVAWTLLAFRDVRTGQEAIDLIRSKRPGALTNQVFVDAILADRSENPTYTPKQAPKPRWLYRGIPAARL